MSRLDVGILRMLLAGGAYILGSVDDSTIGLSDTRCYSFRGYRSGGGGTCPLEVGLLTSLGYEVIRYEVSHSLHLSSSLDWVRVGRVPVSCGR